MILYSIQPLPPPQKQELQQRKMNSIRILMVFGRRNMFNIYELIVRVWHSESLYWTNCWCTRNNIMHVQEEDAAINNLTWLMIGLFWTHLPGKTIWPFICTWIVGYRLFYMWLWQRIHSKIKSKLNEYACVWRAISTFQHYLIDRLFGYFSI